MHDDETVGSSPYLEEFREIFKRHRLHFGVPEDIFPFTKQMDESAVLREEISAAMHGIIRREGGAIPSAEMVKMLGVAVGGPYFDARAPETLAAYRKLEGFMIEVVRSFRTSLRDGEARSTAIGDPVAGRAKEEVHAGEDVVEPRVAEMISAGREVALGAAASGTRPNVGESRTVSGTGPAAHEQSFYVAAETRREEIVTPVAQRRSYWLAAVLALVVVVGFGLVWHSRSRVGSVPPVERMVEQGATVSGVTTTGMNGSTGLGPVESAGLPVQVPVGRGGGQGSTAGASAGSPAAMRGIGPVQTQGALPEVVEGDAAGKVEAGAVQVVRGEPGATGDGAQVVAVPPPARARASNAKPVRPASAPVAGGFLVSSGVMGRNLLSKPVMPSYPKMAAMWGIEGQVILQVVVSSNGKVLSTNVLRGHRLLRGAAQKAVSQWIYRPRVVGGKAVDVATVVIVEFKRHP